MALHKHHAQEQQLITNARQLRSNTTDAERKLWYLLRANRLEGYKFRRQFPMDTYIADFVCLEQRLVIELDGGQHALAQTYDAKRTAYLESQGFQVLRFWNNDVLGNIEGVLEVILSALRSPLSPALPRKGGGSSSLPEASADA